MRLLFAFSIIFVSCTSKNQKAKIVVLISAHAEWNVVKNINPHEKYDNTPWGEFFSKRIATKKGNVPVIFFHEGWGKVAGAGATQYAIDRWNPEVMINLGTCGGFEGSVQRFDILLIDKSAIYDIKEAMGDSKEAIQDYSTEIDLSWIEIPDTIRRTILVSADRDLIPAEIEMLRQDFGAIAGDWETGAIAYTCKRNNKKLLVLRGVTDLVSTKAGEAYGNPEVFVNGTEIVMKKLLNDLPFWLSAIREN